MASLDEILQRISSLPKANNFWSILVVEPEREREAVEELEDTIPIFIDEGIEVIAVTVDLEILVRAVVNCDRYILMWQFDLWRSEQWREFDYERSQFSHDRGGIMLMTTSAVKQFQLYAPNFASWIGSRVYELQLNTEILTETESERRLEALRQYTGKTDAEIIRLAEIGQLPTDPEYGEWLVLLNRGDLLERTIDVAEI